MLIVAKIASFLISLISGGFYLEMDSVKNCRQDSITVLLGLSLIRFGPNLIK